MGSLDEEARARRERDAPPLPIEVSPRRSAPERIGQTVAARPLPHVAVRAPLAGPLVGVHAEILSGGALAFLARLARRFEPERQELLRQRRRRQRELDSGRLPEFLSSTRRIRAAAWQVAPLPTELSRRRTEVIAPVTRRALHQALRSGADSVLADFEHMHSPTWRNNLDGQVNLRELSRIRWAEGGAPPLVMVRPRGWHLDERHLLVDGVPMAASLFDFGLSLYHNVAACLRRRSHPYYYLPKLENHLEARLWADVIAVAQAELDLPAGAIRVTISIDNVLAAFEMDEVLWELRAHAVGLACGGDEYLGSLVQKFHRRRECLLPERSALAFERGGLADYVRLLIATCHRRAVAAVSGVARALPIAEDADADRQVLEHVFRQKRRERQVGFDVLRLAYPGFAMVAQLAAEEPRTVARRPHPRSASSIRAAELLALPSGEVSVEAVLANVDLVLRFLSAWLGGSGRVSVAHRLEDAASADLARAQLWQWAHHRAALRDGRRVNLLWLRQLIAERLRELGRDDTLDSTRLAAAGLLLERLCMNPECAEFLTAAAYEFLG